jgi:hypothetical protein
MRCLDDSRGLGSFTRGNISDAGPAEIVGPIIAYERHEIRRHDLAIALVLFQVG